MTIDEITALAKKHNGKRRRKGGTFGVSDKRGWRYRPVAQYAFWEGSDLAAFIVDLPDKRLAAHGPCDEHEYYWVYVWLRKGEK